MNRRRSYAEAMEGGALEDIASKAKTEAMNKHAVYISSSSDESVDLGHIVAKKASSSRQTDDKDLKESDMNKFGTNAGFIRSDSVKYYDMRNSSKSLHPGEGDAASHQSVSEIYNTCLNYVSSEHLHARKNTPVGDYNQLHRAIGVGSSNSSHHHSDDINPYNATKEGTDMDKQNLNSIELRNVEMGDRVVNRLQEQRPHTTMAVTRIHQNQFDDIEEYEDSDEHLGERKNSFFPVLYTGKNISRKARKNPENFGARAKKQKRVVFKNGDMNIPLRHHIMGRFRIYMNDIVTTLVECRWRWVILLFSACNFLVWLAFAAMFYIAAMANGDFLEDEEGFEKSLCIENGRSFTGLFTFSVETQVSIGYGEKSPTTACPEVIFIILMEVIFGYAMIGVLVCIVFAKIVRPEKHLEGVGFSKNAVVCMRDGKMCLVFRAWDCLQKHSISAQAHGWLVKHTVGSIPVILPLNLGQSPLLLWPTTIQHTIDEKSPLYDMSAKDLLDRKFEIIITLTGASRSTGQLTQSRTSYMSHEILWGSRFKNVMKYNSEEQAYQIDKKSIHAVVSMDIPLCSAKVLKEVNDALMDDPFPLSPPSTPFISPVDSPFWDFSDRKLNNDFNKSLP